ncbi:MAG TPA: hypothetical protein VGM43_27075 [Bryobacteraceae bacterium]|jgi:hypothetical protein
MIATAIPHSAFDNAACRGRLKVVGRAGLTVDFVCNKCGATVACARQEDTGAALQILNLAACVTCVHCLHCGFANKMAGLDAIYASVCQECHRAIYLPAAPGLRSKTPTE